MNFFVILHKCISLKCFVTTSVSNKMLHSMIYLENHVLFVLKKEIFSIISRWQMRAHFYDITNLIVNNVRLSFWAYINSYMDIWKLQFFTIGIFYDTIFSFCENILDYTFDIFLSIIKLKKLNNSIDVGIIYIVINNIGLTAQYSDIS